MTFDKSKVFTSLNADELKVGSKVVVGDSLLALKIQVSKGKYQYIESIRDESSPCRFKISSGSKRIFNLAYLVEEPQEQGLKWTGLRIGDVLRRKTLLTMVVGIQSDSYPTTDLHICLSTEGWVTDNRLQEFDLVEEKNN